MSERLQKVIARAGIASRRAAEQMIREGRVRVNGKTITRLGTKVDIGECEIRIDGKLILSEVAAVYVMVNKPKGCVTTLRDTRGRPIVTDLLGDVFTERLFPVGRLDYDSEGLLLMTNDGEFAHRVQHPKFEVSKTYTAKIKGNLTKEDIASIRNGIMLEDGAFTPLRFSVETVNKKSCWIEIVIHEGRNRVIRRVFDAIGHPVVRLIRTAVGDLTLEDLRPGEVRYLQKKEVTGLLRLSKI